MASANRPHHEDALVFNSRRRGNQGRGRGRIQHGDRSGEDATLAASRNWTLLLAQQSFNEEHRRLREDTACSRILIPKNTTVLQLMKMLAGDVPITEQMQHVARDEMRARVFAGIKNKTIVSRLDDKCYSFCIRRII